jgi:hypothetical protein
LPCWLTCTSNSPVSGLPPATARGARLDAVHDGVAQQVLERRGHLFQHAAVDFHRAAADIEVDAFVGFLRGLARDAEQALGQARERHHAHAHQVALQVARHARLRRQFFAGAVDRARERFVEGGDVVDALGHHAREFLQAREAVEFERVEFALAGDRHARGDLRFGLHLDFAQLAAQAVQVVREVGQRALEDAHLVFQFRARDRDLAGLGHQAVEDVGAHPHQRRARFQRRQRLGGGGVRPQAALRVPGPAAPAARTAPAPVS